MGIQKIETYRETEEIFKAKKTENFILVIDRKPKI